MAVYKVLLKSSASREIESLPTKEIRRRVVDRINALASNPRPPGCEKLAAQHDRYRVRQGRYRIVYEVLDREVLVVVVRVADRKDVYR